MTSGINLETLWIPVMPETSHIGEAMKDAGTLAKSKFEEGFNQGGSGGSTGDNAQTFGGMLGQRMLTGIGEAELPMGANRLVEKLFSTVDPELTKKLKGELPQLYREYTSATNELTEAKQREAKITQELSAMTPSGGMYLSALRSQVEAHKSVEAAASKSNEAGQKYNSTLTQMGTSSSTAFNASEMLAGAMGGAVVLGVMSAAEGIEKLEEAVLDFAKESLEKIEEVGEKYEQLGIQIHKFSTASGEDFERLESSAARVFASLDVSGANTGTTLAMLSSRLHLTGPALEELTRHVEMLQGRFGALNVKSLAADFAAFGVKGEDADKVLASWLQSARSAGLALPDLTDSIDSVGVALAKAGLNAQQAGAFIAEVDKIMGNAKQAMQGLSQAEKIFADPKQMGGKAVDFTTGLRMAAQELKRLSDAGDTVKADALAEKLFGARRWAEAMTMIQKYFQILDAGPDHFNAPANSLDEFGKQTQSVGDKWEHLQHQFESALAPLGIAFEKGLGEIFDKMSNYLTKHQGEIRQFVQNLGDSFIRLLPTIKNFGVIFLDVLSYAADAAMDFEKLITEAFILITETMAAPVKLLAAILPDEFPGAKQIKDAAKALDQAVAGSKNLQEKLNQTHPGDGLRHLADTLQGLKIDVPELTGKFDDMVRKLGSDGLSGAAGEADRAMGGLGHSLGSVPSPGGSAPGMPMPGGGGHGRIRGAGYGTGDDSGGGGSNADSMISRIQDDAAAAGLTDVETRMIIATGKHESNWKGPGYMGYGPEANAAGLDFSSNPLGAVDQFIQQYMSRRAQLTDPNSPQAVANFIWHVVHGASDPNYGPELLGVFNSGNFFDAGGSSPWMMPSGFGGPKGKDTQLSWFTPGEYVWDTKTMDKWGWLIRGLHNEGRSIGNGIASELGFGKIFGNAPKYFDTGGSGSSDYAASGRGNDRPDLVDPQLQYIMQIANEMGLTLTAGRSGHGTHGVDKGWHDSGQAGDFSNGQNTNEELAFAKYMFEHFGSELSELIYSDPRMPKLIKDGRVVDPGFYGADTLAGHRDHVHVAIRASQDLSDVLSPGSEPLVRGQTGWGGPGGSLPASPLGFGSGGTGSTPGGKGGGQFPGLTGQYGGQGAYGGETEDERLRDQHAVDQARRRKQDMQESINEAQADLDRLKAKRDELKAKGTGPFGAATPEELAEEDRKVAAAEKRLRDAQRGFADQDYEIMMAERKQQEDARKAPKGKGKGDEGLFEQFGAGLLKGVASDLGFGSVFGKPPWEWGIWKLFAGGASYGLNILNALGDASGGGGMGATPSGFSGDDAGAPTGDKAAGGLGGLLPSLIPKGKDWLPGGKGAGPGSDDQFSHGGRLDQRGPNRLYPIAASPGVQPAAFLPAPQGDSEGGGGDVHIHNAPLVSVTGVGDRASEHVDAWKTAANSKQFQHMGSMPS